MVLRLIGTGTTDANGFAVMDKDADGDPLTHSYTGTGAGELDIVAEVTIDGSSVVSQPSSVLDCIYYDAMGENNGGTLVRMTRSQESNGCLLTATGDGSHWIFKENNRVFSMPFVIEFEIVSRTIITGGGTAIDVYDGTTEHKIWFDTTGNYKLKVASTGITVMEGSQTAYPPQTIPSGDSRLSFFLGKDGDTVTYKNLEVYPSKV